MSLEKFVSAANAALEGDERILAAWLEGSLGAGLGDDYSDVDLHVAVADSAYEDFIADPATLLARFGTLISWIDVPFPGARLLPATVLGSVGLVRLDLLVEPRSRVPSAPSRVLKKRSVRRGGVSI